MSDVNVIVQTQPISVVVKTSPLNIIVSTFGVQGVRGQQGASGEQGPSGLPGEVPTGVLEQISGLQNQIDILTGMMATLSDAAILQV